MGGGSKKYAVQQGRAPGIYDNWQDCEAQVKYYSGAKFKSFKSEGEAVNYLVNDARQSTPPGAMQTYHQQTYHQEMYRPGPPTQTTRITYSTNTTITVEDRVSFPQKKYDGTPPGSASVPMRRLAR